jgi:hypothetical protein
MTKYPATVREKVSSETDAEIDFVVSAFDVAVTVALSPLAIVAGAVNCPALSSVPFPVIVHVTPVSVALFTVAANFWTNPLVTVALLGERLMETSGMVMLAVADFEGSAFGFAVTVTVPGVARLEGAA